MILNRADSQDGSDTQLRRQSGRTVRLAVSGRLATVGRSPSNPLTPRLQRRCSMVFHDDRSIESLTRGAPVRSTVTDSQAKPLNWVDWAHFPRCHWIVRLTWLSFVHNRRRLKQLSCRSPFPWPSYRWAKFTTSITCLTLDRPLDRLEDERLTCYTFYYTIDRQLLQHAILQRLRNRLQHQLRRLNLRKYNSQHIVKVGGIHVGHRNFELQHLWA